MRDEVNNIATLLIISIKQKIKLVFEIHLNLMVHSARQRRVRLVRTIGSINRSVKESRKLSSENGWNVGGVLSDRTRYVGKAFDWLVIFTDLRTLTIYF
jgi:hypothetical protein